MATYTLNIPDSDSGGTLQKFGPYYPTATLTSRATGNIPRFAEITKVEASLKCYQGTWGSTGDLRIGFGSSGGDPVDLFFDMEHAIPYGSGNAATRTTNNMSARFASKTANAGAYTGGYNALIFLGHSLLARRYYFRETKVVWTYNSPTFTLNVSSGGNGTVSGGNTKTIASKTATYTWNLNAVPNTGYHFVRWSDGNTSASRSYSVTDNDLTSFATSASLSATFAINQYQLSTAVSPTGSGTVTGAGTYNHGSVATLTAAPAVGYRFVRWNEDGSTSASRTVTVNGAATYTAVFAAISYTLTFDGVRTGGSMANVSATWGTGVVLPPCGFEQAYTVTLVNNNGAANSVLTAYNIFAGWVDDNPITYNGVVYQRSQFDAPYYANTYSDLYNAFGYNKYSLLNHYVNYGQGEGRSCVGGGPGLYPNGATLANMTTDHNGTITLWAVWHAGGVTLPTPERDGYTFLGWFTSNAGGTQVVGTYAPGANVTLYARWERNKIEQLFIGTGKVAEIYIGTTPAREVYVGTTKIYG